MYFSLKRIHRSYYRINDVLIKRGAIMCAFLVILLGCSSDNSDDPQETVQPNDPETLDINGLPVRDFEVALPTITGSLSYTIDTEAWEIPTNGSEAITTTQNLQAAIDWAHEEGYTQITLPEGNYLVGEDVNDIYQGGIEIYENTEFIFAEGAILQIETNNKWNYCVLELTGSNIIIRNAEIIGDKDTHIFTPRENDGATSHDEGHGICVFDNTNVLVTGSELYNLTGDGSLVLESENITFIENNIHDNRRQGISVVGGIGISIINNEIHHINGTSPQFGIDIEGAGRVDEDILIQFNSFHHNRGGDIVNASGKNVYILDNVMEQGEGSTYVDGPIVSWHKTHNIIARNTITMVNGSVNGRLGYIQYSRGGDKGHNRSTYVYDNVCNSCGMFMYKSYGADVKGNQFLGYFAAFSEFDNLVLEDNLVTYSEEHPNLRFCWSYRFDDVTGVASGNYLGEDLQEIPLSETEPYTLQCVLDGF